MFQTMLRLSVSSMKRWPSTDIRLTISPTVDVFLDSLLSINDLKNKHTQRYNNNNLVIHCCSKVKFIQHINSKKNCPSNIFAVRSCRLGTKPEKSFVGLDFGVVINIRRIFMYF